MQKIATPNELQDELRRVIAYAESELPSRARIAADLNALSDRLAGTRQASGRTYNDFLKEADAGFLQEVGKLVMKGQHSVQAKVHSPGGSTMFLVLEGEDSSDMPIDGYASVIHTGSFDVKFYVELETVNGKSSDEKEFKIGVLTTDLAAKMILQFLNFAR